MKLNVKLYTFIGGIVVIAFVIFGVNTYNFQKKVIDRTYQESIQEYLNNYTQMINLEVESKQKSSSIGINLASNYLKSLGSITETSEQVDVNEHSLNKWIVAGKQVQNNADIISTIEGFGIKAASIFQKTSKGYVRIATNVKSKEGKLVLGTVVPFDSPVIQAIEKGEIYTGRLKIIDTWYLSSFAPIRVNGVIKGMIGVGEPEINYQGFSEDFKTKKYFGSGYPYIVDENGVLTAHPQSVGLSVAEYDFFKEMKEKKNGFVVYEWKGREKTQYFRYIEPIKSFITVGWYTEDYEAIFDELRNTLIVEILIALLVVIAVIYFVVRSVMKQLGADPKELQEISNKVAEGDFSMNINLKQGDTNSLLASMNKMVQTVKSMVQDVQKLGNSATEGKLDVRADASKFQGEYKQLVQGLNSIFDAIIGPLNVAAEYIDRISKGDVPPKIVDEYKGDFNEIKNNMNVLIDTLELLVKDIDIMTNAAAAGKLDVRVDANKHQGVFRTLINGLNDTINNIVRPLNVAAEYIDRISKGDVPPRIVDDYKGDFNEIKNNLNLLIDSTQKIADDILSLSKGDLNVSLAVRSENDVLIKSMKVIVESLKALANDSIMLAKAAKEGKITQRADASKHQGEFKAIVQGVNDTLDSLVGILDKLPIPLMGIDKEFNILYINNAGASLDNKTGKDFIGSKCYNHLKTSHCQTNDCACHLSMQKKIQVEQETDAHPGNLDLEIKYIGFPILNEKGEAIGSYEAVIDETNIKKFLNTAKKKADYMNEQTKKMIVALEELAAGNFNAKADFDEPDEDTKDNFELLAQIRSAIRDFTHTVFAIKDDVIRLAKEAADGNLNERADETHYKGEFKNIVENLNLLLQTIVEPITKEIEIMQKLANGDLTERMTGEYKGEFKKLQEATNHSIEALNELLTQVAVTVDEVTRGAMQVSDASTALSQGATEQAASLEEITSSMSQIGSQTKTNAENANQANLLTFEAKEAAEKGNREMLQLNSAMEEITESSRNISKIIKVIDEIAFQTNLLALNAAVEAARAGRHGKGFAVVAEEVRNLAARSATAAKETSELIENSIKAVENGSMIAVRTGESLEEIKNSSVKVADIVGEIATSSNEQALAISQINEGLSQIDKVTQTNTASAEESASAAEELSGQAAQLKSMIARFKLSNENVQFSNFESSHYVSGRRSRSLPHHQSEQPSHSEVDLGSDMDYTSDINPSDIIKLDENDFGRY